MDGQSWLVLVGTLGIPVIVSAFVSYAGVRRQLRQTGPKTSAEAEAALAQARAMDIEAQGGIVSRLSAENQRLDRALANTTTRLDDYRTRLEQLEEKFETVADQNQVLKRQNAILTESLSRASVWMKRYYDAGHPQGMAPPPTFVTFDESP